MRIPKYFVPLVLRFLSLAGLSSAGGGDKALVVGFALSASSSSGAAAFPATTSQAREHLDINFGLDLDFFVKVGELEVKVPIMPL